MSFKEDERRSEVGAASLHKYMHNHRGGDEFSVPPGATDLREDLSRQAPRVSAGMVQLE